MMKINLCTQIKKQLELTEKELHFVEKESESYYQTIQTYTEETENYHSSNQTITRTISIRKIFFGKSGYRMPRQSTK